MHSTTLTTRQRLREYALLMRMDKPIGTLLLLWPTLWGLWLAADGMPDWHVLLVFVLGVFLMRSAGCAINDFADRNIDGRVQRTQQRPLAANRISAKEAVLLAASLALVAFALVLTMNSFTIMLSFVAVTLAATYPFMKRYTHLPQVYLGAAFAWAIPMSFAAQTGEIPSLAWWLFIITILWTTAYDTMYAMVDRDDDLKIGVKSTAILFGQADIAIIAALQGLVLGGFILIGLSQSLGLFYYAGILLAAGLAMYQLWLIRNRQRDCCFRAFLNNNWLGAAVFAGIFLDTLTR
ncbi:MAG: 4-hydroxybenzoate octaprenyltransferase [Gammaproteobacteria bacterium]|nr:4-hydroxybenzoate octaprenyltransferase [Gammaproteobacteria bacterium]